LDPSGGTLEVTTPPYMKPQTMLRDGFLVVAHFKYEPEDEGIPGYSAIDLRSPATGWRHTEIQRHVISFDCSIEQNLVATLHMYVGSLGDFCHRLSENTLEMVTREGSDFYLHSGPSIIVLKDR
jgi:hypothetical protein